MMARIVAMMGTRDFIFNLAAGNTNLRVAALNAGWDGASRVVATVNSGVFITTGLTVNGSFPNGEYLVLNSGGGVYGIPGSGRSGGYSTANGNAGNPGGTALTVSVPLTVINNGIIVGGGGGGGGGGGSKDAGGGSFYGGDGGLGGGYFPAQSGTAGGSLAGNGGNGGSAGSAGYAGTNGMYWNGTAWIPTLGGAGGAAGNAVTGNSNITWLTPGILLGPIT